MLSICTAPSFTFGDLCDRDIAMGAIGPAGRRGGDPRRMFPLRLKWSASYVWIANDCQAEAGPGMAQASDFARASVRPVAGVKMECQ